MFVRTATERDLPAIHGLLVETWHATYDPIYGAENVAAINRKWHSVAALRADLARARSEFLVADDGSALSGTAYAAAIGDDARTIMLHRLFVRPPLQGRGVGGMLLGEMEDSFFESERMRVEVEERNARAMAFFTSQGYVPSGRHQAGTALILILEKSLLAEA